jgi:hypothetical protein
MGVKHWHSGNDHHNKERSSSSGMSLRRSGHDDGNRRLLRIAEERVCRKSMVQKGPFGGCDSASDNLEPLVGVDDLDDGGSRQE